MTDNLQYCAQTDLSNLLLTNNFHSKNFPRPNLNQNDDCFKPTLLTKFNKYLAMQESIKATSSNSFNSSNNFMINQYNELKYINSNCKNVGDQTGNYHTQRQNIDSGNSNSANSAYSSLSPNCQIRSSEFNKSPHSSIINEKFNQNQNVSNFTASFSGSSQYSMSSTDVRNNLDNVEKFDFVKKLNDENDKTDTDYQTMMIPTSSKYSNSMSLIDNRFYNSKYPIITEDYGKLFVGGLPTGITEPEFKKYFMQFGTVLSAVIKTNPKTGISRGFGFITFKEDFAVRDVMNHVNPHVINGKVVDPKQAKKEDSLDNECYYNYEETQRFCPISGTNFINTYGPINNYSSNINTAIYASRANNYKIFVGGLPVDADENHLHDYFKQFGPISFCEIKRNPDTKQSRGFAFVTFSTTDSIIGVMSQPEHWICGKRVDPKMAEQKPISLQRENLDKFNQISETDINNQIYKYHSGSRPIVSPNSEIIYQNTKNVDKICNTYMYDPAIYNYQCQEANKYDVDLFLANYNINQAEIDIDQAADQLKLFVGGLHKDTTVKDLVLYFHKFGQVHTVLIKYDQITKVSRGFGFILFKHESACQKVLSQNDHRLLGKIIDPKPAEPYNSLPSVHHKLFVGGVNSLKHDIKNLQEHFEKFGIIKCIIWDDQLDKNDNLIFNSDVANFKKVGFLYIVYADVGSVLAAAKQRYHIVNNVEIEAKICDKSATRKTICRIDGRLMPAKQSSAKYRVYPINDDIPATTTKYNNYTLHKDSMLNQLNNYYSKQDTIYFPNEINLSASTQNYEFENIDPEIDDNIEKKEIDDKIKAQADYLTTLTMDDDDSGKEIKSIVSGFNDDKNCYSESPKIDHNGHISNIPDVTDILNRKCFENTKKLSNEENFGSKSPNNLFYKNYNRNSSIVSSVLSNQSIPPGFERFKSNSSINRERYCSGASNVNEAFICRQNLPDNIQVQNQTLHRRNKENEDYLINQKFNQTHNTNKSSLSSTNMFNHKTDLYNTVDDTILPKDLSIKYKYQNKLQLNRRHSTTGYAFKTPSLKNLEYNCAENNIRNSFNNVNKINDTEQDLCSEYFTGINSKSLGNSLNRSNFYDPDYKFTKIYKPDVTATITNPVDNQIRKSSINSTFLDNFNKEPSMLSQSTSVLSSSKNSISSELKSIWDNKELPSKLW